MHRWIDDLAEKLTAGKPCVLVTVAGIRGSAPRDAGAKMLVTERDVIGTIGGGQLEYKCAKIAFEALRTGEDRRYFRKFALGANCGQCCGGVVEVLFEPFCANKPRWLELLQRFRDRRESVLIATGQHTKYLIDARGICRYPRKADADDKLLAEALQMLKQKKGAQKMDDEVLLEPIMGNDMSVAVFGAGHVGTATVNTLSTLDCNIRWIDGRRKIFPKQLPDNVQKIESERPELEVAALPAGTCYLVMTHSHPLDLAIVQQVLERGDFGYCGLIGSVSKRRSFEKRLLKLGLTKPQLTKLTCPIGIAGIDSKKPAAIAIAVAAELLQIRAAGFSTHSGGNEMPDNVHILRQR